MEPFQREFIRQNKPELQKLTDCNTSLIAYLESKYVLGDYDKATLKAIPNEMDKAAELYEILIKKPHSYDILRDALRDSCQTGALNLLDQIENSPGPSSNSSREKKRIKFGVRSPVALFTGRETEIALIHEYMTSQENETRTTTISGLGGIGKTELCRKYIELYFEYYDGNVIWIQAERRSDTIQNFRTVASSELDISLENDDGSDKDIKTVVDEVYSYFLKKKVLFVFDNAVSSDDDDLDIFMPDWETTKAVILITSRDRFCTDIPSKTLVLGELNEGEAVEFVKKGLKIEDSCQDDVIKKLVTRLQCLPLAIQQAVSFIEQRGKLRTFKIAEYLTQIEANTQQLLNSKLNKYFSNKYTKTTYTTWKMTMDLIASEEDFGKLSIKYLKIMAYFEPDKIPIRLFSLCEDISQHSSYDIDSALLLLVKYSMINSQPSEELLSIHRLVQEVIRIDIKVEREEEQVLKDCLSIFNIDIDEDILDYNSVNHAKSVLEFSCLFPLLLKSYPGVPVVVGETLMFMDSLECGPLCEKYHKKLSIELDEGAVELIHLEFYIARGLQMEKQFEKCLDALYQVLAKYMSIQTSKNDFFVERTKLAIVETLKQLERFEEALEIATTIFKEKGTQPVAEIIQEAVPTFDLYLTKRNFKGALDWCETVMDYLHLEEKNKLPELSQEGTEDERECRLIEEIWKRVLKFIELDDNGYSFGAKLAFHLSIIKKDKGFSQLDFIIYQVVSEIYGEEHPGAIKPLVRIGLNHVKMGEYEKAVTVYQKPGVAKMIDIENFEVENLNINNTASCLFAKALSETGAHEEAMGILVKTLETLTGIYGDEHESVVGVLYQISKVYENMGRVEDALYNLGKAEKIADKLSNFDPVMLHKICTLKSQLSSF